MRLPILLFVIFVASFSTSCSTNPTPAPLPIQPTDSPERATAIATDPILQTGEQTYLRYCAHCHGYGGEGQPPASAQNTINLGMNTVPPHNATGHTWQHPNQLLIEVIQTGIQNPLDHFPMPAFEGRLSDEEIAAVIEYIKLWWTDEQRQHQRAVTERRAEIEAEFGISEEG